MLQTLSTFKLSPEQAADPNLDIITGFQLVDGKTRLFVLEGLSDGAMKILDKLAVQVKDTS